MPTLISFGAQLRNLAVQRPAFPAVTCGDTTLTRAELDRRSDALAVEFRRLGVGLGDMVTLCLPNSFEWVVAAVALWKLGAIPQPVSARLPLRELEAVVELADPVLVLGIDPDRLPGRTCLPLGFRPPEPDGPVELPDVVSPAWKAPTSGGSTGRPKLIVSGDPGLVDPSSVSRLQFSSDGCLVMPGPLYHNGPVVWTCYALLHGSHVVLLPRFDAEATLAAVAEYRADVLYLVPTMMKRIWRLPPRGAPGLRPLIALRVVWHLAEPCPPWLKEAWIEWFGPERIFELYAGTEAQVAHRHHRHRVAGASRIGGFPRAAMSRSAIRTGGYCRLASKVRSGSAPNGPLLPTGMWEPKPESAPVGGSRSATWAGSTRTAISIWAIGPRT